MFPVGTFLQIANGGFQERRINRFWSALLGPLYSRKIYREYTTVVRDREI